MPVLLRPRPFPSALIVAFCTLLPVASTAFAGQKKTPGEAKYRLTPTMSKESPTGVAIPQDLDAAMTELDHMLSKELKAEMRKVGESAMSQCHMGLGMWIRNEWGFWKGLELAKWFNKNGIFHPDDMSGVILTSYWRHLHGKPLNFAGQVRSYQAYWKAAAVEEEKEQARAARAKITIRNMMLGVTLAPAASRSVRLPKAESLGFRTRYAAPYGQGVILTAKRFTPESFGKDPDFVVRSFFLDLNTHQLHPVVDPSGATVEDSVVIGGHAYLNCVAGGKGHIVDASGKDHATIPWPALGTTARRPVRLGIEETPEGKPQGLIAYGNGRLARWKGSRWEFVPCGKVTFPDCVLPVRKIGDRLVFRDEGYGEDNKRLSWIDLKQPRGLISFDRHVGVVGSEGPRWENVWDYAVTPSGTWWLAVGEHEGTRSLLRWTRQDGYHVAVYNESLRWMSDFFGHPDSGKEVTETGLSITAVEAQPNGSLRAIGPNGMYILDGKSLKPILYFEHGPADWTPSTLLELSPTLTLVGGHWGGLYLLEKQTDESTIAENVGDRLATSVKL